MAPRIKLGELLVRAQVLDEARLQVALSEQKLLGGKLGSLLVSRGFVAEDVMVKALSKQLGIPVAELDKLDVPVALAQKIGRDFARKNTICPERLIADRRILVIAMWDPIDVVTIDQVARKTGLRIQTTVASERAINQAIAMLFGSEVQESHARFERIEASWGSPMLDTPATLEKPEQPEVTLETLTVAQQAQLKTIRALCDLLLEKGLISRAEYETKMQRRGGRGLL